MDNLSQVSQPGRQHPQTSRAGRQQRIDRKLQGQRESPSKEEHLKAKNFTNDCANVGIEVEDTDGQHQSYQDQSYHPPTNYEPDNNDQQYLREDQNYFQAHDHQFMQEQTCGQFDQQSAMIIKNNLTERNEQRDEHDERLHVPEMENARQLFAQYNQHQLIDGEMADSLLQQNFDQ